MRLDKKFWLLAGLALSAVTLTACGPEEQGSFVARPTESHPTTYKKIESAPVFVRDVTLVDGRGGWFEKSSLLIKEGKIADFGADLTVPEGAVIVDGTGRFLTPGIIDVHSHLGVYASPGTPSHADGNEIGEPVTADVAAEHSLWPQDPGFLRAAAGGITSLQLLPGSANLVGGRSVIIKNLPGRTAQDMKFPGAPYGLKMACGENPKRVYGSGDHNMLHRPSTRMGNVAGYRQAFADAQDYIRRVEKYERDYKAGRDVLPPKRDLKLETLAGVIKGEISLQIHCYRADDMATMIDTVKEFGGHVSAFHHAVESYKIADILARENICSAMWADWWGFKMEAYDGIRENLPFVHKAGACAIVHSDSEVGIQRLNQEAAKALADGKRAGVDISKADAWQWLSYNPAKALGIEQLTGSIEKGKQADLVLWSSDPFSVYAKADMTFVDGFVVYDRLDPSKQPVSDFDVGQQALVAVHPVSEGK